MTNKEKALALSKFYTELAKSDNGVETIAALSTPNMSCKLDMYRVNPPKPEVKIIDLSMMVGSDIDMEFTNLTLFQGWSAKLREIRDNFYISIGSGSGYLKCRIRQNHVHFWAGGKCPLPEGLVVKLFLRDGVTMIISNDDVVIWGHHNMQGDVIGFEILGTQHGYAYEVVNGEE